MTYLSEHYEQPSAEEFWERVAELEYLGVAEQAAIAVACDEYFIEIDDVPHLREEGTALEPNRDLEGRIFFWGMVICLATTIFNLVMIYVHGVR
jgi:hypothetical protein